MGSLSFYEIHLSSQQGSITVRVAVLRIRHTVRVAVLRIRHNNSVDLCTQKHTDERHQEYAHQDAAGTVLKLQVDVATKHYTCLLTDVLNDANQKYTPCSRSNIVYMDGWLTSRRYNCKVQGGITCSDPD